MRLNFSRNALAAFLLALGCGVGLWYFLVQRDAAGWLRNSQHKPSRLSKLFPNNDSEPQVRFVPCQLVDDFKGYTNVSKVKLRAAPSESAAVVAEIRMQYLIEILGATRDFLHVKYPARGALTYVEEKDKAGVPSGEGWTSWGEVFSDESVLVLDSESGAVVSRFLLPYNGYERAFSPDGQRIIFYGDGGAHEVQTRDYTVSRCLHATNEYSIESVFYHPDGALYAVVSAPHEPGEFRNRPMKLLRVSLTGGPSQLTDISAVATDFEISRDRRTGFIFYRTDDGRYRLYQVDVVDLQTLKIRNSFKLDCEECPSWFVLNDSGSELYIKPFRVPFVWVIDTGTGKRVRELPYGDNDFMPPYVTVVGDSLYFEDYSKLTGRHQRVLLRSDGTKVIDPLDNPLIPQAAVAGGSRFNIADGGTRLLELDADGHVQRTFPIERPELKLNPDAAHYILAGGLTPVPNSKRLLLFVGYSMESRATMECSPTTRRAAHRKH